MNGNNSAPTKCVSPKETEISHGLIHLLNLFLPLISSVLPTLDQFKQPQREPQGVKTLQVVLIPTHPPVSSFVTECGCSEVPSNTYFV